MSGRCCYGVGLSGLKFFACSGVSIEKEAMWYPFRSVSGCFTELLMSTAYQFSSAVVRVGQMMRSSLSCRSDEGLH